MGKAKEVPKPVIKPSGKKGKKFPSKEATMKLVEQIAKRQGERTKTKEEFSKKRLDVLEAREVRRQTRRERKIATREKAEEGMRQKLNEKKRKEKQERLEAEKEAQERKKKQEISKKPIKRVSFA